MRVEATDGKTASRPSAYRALRSLVLRMRIVAQDRREASVRKRELAAGPTIAARQADLVEFYGRFEALVETLCSAAQLGPTDDLESRYGAQRKWLHSNYIRVKPYVLAFLQYSVEDAQQCIAAHGRGGDAFDALIEAEDLAEFLRIDDGSMISRIDRTREALVRYADHLRWLKSGRNVA